MIRGGALLVVLMGALGVCAAPTAAEAQEKILLTGVTRGPRFDMKLTKGLAEHIERAGESILRAPNLAMPDRLCGDQDCMERLAKREGGQVALAAQIRQSGGSNFYVTMALVDISQRVPMQIEGSCDVCLGEALQNRLNTLCDQLLRTYRDRKNQPADLSSVAAVAPGAAVSPGAAVPAVPSPSAVSPTPAAAPHDPGLGLGLHPEAEKAAPLVQLTPRRKLIAGVLGGVGAAALIASIALAATDKQYTSLPCEATSPEGKCRLDNLPLYGTGFAITGAAVIGIGVTLFWPADKARAAETK